MKVTHSFFLRLCVSILPSPLAAEKKTPKMVHLEIFFGPSYFETALVLLKQIDKECTY